jgi:DNA (cytosine-5)-methyltransferase 1
VICVGSLCSGYEGIGLGLELALGPVEHTWFVEYDSEPSKILAHRFPGVPNHGDVKHTDWTQVAPIDVLTAGYPCQPFSHAGLRKGADDPRHLWPGVARAISDLRPRLAFLENVRGHVSLGLDAVLGDLADLGYDTRWGLVPASRAGAAHGRARVFIAATDTQSDPWGLLNGDSPAAPDAHDKRGERRRRARDGRTGPQDSSPLDGDATLRLMEGGHDAGVEGGRRSEGAQAQAGAGHCAPADADRLRLDWVAQQHAPAATRLDSQRRGHPDGRGDGPDWGPYAGAVSRWEGVTGRAAPRPTEPAAGGGERLAPNFVEWLMGLPAGWVTEVPGLSRVAQLKALGNGVVPQQAALALQLLGVTAMEAAA